MIFKDKYFAMDRTLEHSDRALQQWNRLDIHGCDSMKTGDIQILLRKDNFEENDFDPAHHLQSGIEFMWPWAAGKDAYHTYKTFAKFIDNDNMYLANKSFDIYHSQEKTVAIRGDFMQGTCYLQITNTKDDILNVLIKGGKNNSPLKIADSEVDINLLTSEKLPLYTGEKRDIIIITQEELHRLFKIMESIEKDVEDKPELFKAML